MFLLYNVIIYLIVVTPCTIILLLFFFPNTRRPVNEYMTDYYLLALFTVCLIVRCMSTLMCIYFLSSVLLVDLTLYILLHRITGWSYIMHLLPAGYTVLLLLSHILLAQLYSQMCIYV